MARGDAKKKKLLKELQESPIVQVACKKAGVDRSTYYRWLKTDEEFEEAAMEALKVSGDKVSDLAQSQLISLIKGGSFQATVYWLSRRNPEFAKQPTQVRQTKGLIDPVAAILRGYGLLIQNKDGTRRNRFL